MKVPSTIAELNQAANLPFDTANGLISQADKALVEKWGRGLYPQNWANGYLHSSDHKYALRILLDREPTFRETYDSWHGGPRNIDLARIKSGGGARPEGWDSWDDESRRYAVLVHLNGIVLGSKILDGARKDPNPKATAQLLALWSGTVEPELPPPPVEPPVEQPAASFSGIVTGRDGDRTRTFKISLVEVK